MEIQPSGDVHRSVVEVLISNDHLTEKLPLPIQERLEKVVDAARTAVNGLSKVRAKLER